MKRVIKHSNQILSSTQLSDFKIKLDGMLLSEYVGSDEHVIVPEGIERIGPGAFAYCNTLKSVTLPDGLLFISPYAFENCHSLVSVEIPDSLKRIEWQAFFKCSSLTSIDIPDGVVVERAAFKGTPLYDLIEETPIHTSSSASNDTGNEDSMYDEDDLDDGDMSFDDWYESDEFDQDMDIFGEKIQGMLKQSRADISQVWSEPSIQGYSGLHTWFIMMDGHKISVDFDWYDEISSVYEDGPELAAEQYAQEILAQLQA